MTYLIGNLFMFLRILISKNQDKNPSQTFPACTRPSLRLNALLFKQSRWHEVVDVAGVFQKIPQKCGIKRPPAQTFRNAGLWTNAEKRRVSWHEIHFKRDMISARLSYNGVEPCF